MVKHNPELLEKFFDYREAFGLVRTFLISLDKNDQLAIIDSINTELIISNTLKILLGDDLSDERLAKVVECVNIFLTDEDTKEASDIVKHWELVSRMLLVRMFESIYVEGEVSQTGDTLEGYGLYRQYRAMLDFFNVNDDKNFPT